MTSEARRILNPETRRVALHRAWSQLPFFLWLIVLWMLLWAQFTPLSFVTGLIVAIVVTNVFKLPAAELSGRVNLWYGLVFVVTFLWAVVNGSLSVAWQVLDPRRPARTAIIAVPIRSEDDLIMTHVGVTASLIPGSLIVETDRERHILYLHVIGVRTVADVDDFRRVVMHWEWRIVRAVGSRAQVRMLREARAADAARGAPGSAAGGSGVAGGHGHRPSSRRGASTRTDPGDPRNRPDQDGGHA